MCIIIVNGIMYYGQYEYDNEYYSFQLWSIEIFQEMINMKLYLISHSDGGKSPMMLVKSVST